MFSLTSLSLDEKVLKSTDSRTNPLKEKGDYVIIIEKIPRDKQEVHVTNEG